jgi:SpoVK/Ycf46/Vps4 family AAA+-type ATPase
MANEVGEIGRVLNSLLQMIEQDSSNSLILAAANHPESLDGALFRRFDDVLRYELPDQPRWAKLLKARLSDYLSSKVGWKDLAALSDGMSYAELAKASYDVIKAAIIRNVDSVSEADIASAIAEKMEMASRLKNTI